ncbi:MAG: hypothetical protein R3B09_07625 [Nannocystaceae bacterium]
MNQTPGRPDDPREPARRRHAACISLGAVLLLDLLVTIEWSFPRCSAPVDGPLPAVFGAPLPYERWCGALSLVYEFMPHVYVLDVAIFFAAIYPLVRWALRRAPPRFSAALGGVGVALVLFVGLIRAVDVASGEWDPVVSIDAPSYDDHYGDYRPIDITTRRHTTCTPSTYWFPAGAPSR